MKPKVSATGTPVAREHRDGGRVKLSTFIPLKIRKRGASKVVVRPDGQVEAPGKVASQIDQPLLVALTRAFYWQQLLDDGVVGSGSEIARLLWFQRNPLPTDWVAQREVVAEFDA
jgi:hypothetical protein